MSKKNSITQTNKDLTQKRIEDKELARFECVNPINQDDDSHFVVTNQQVEGYDEKVSKSEMIRMDLANQIYRKFAYFSGAKGLFTVQVFHDNGSQDINGIEINPRFAGSYPGYEINAKANATKYLIQEHVINQPASFSNNWQSDMLMFRYDDAIFKIKCDDQI